MLPADMGGVSASTAADLKVGAGVLLTFKQRIDKLLEEFEGSAGSATKVGEHRISRASLKGVGQFPEADALFTNYEHVHEQLIRLSKSLGMQIEAMGIATQGAQNGFNTLDEEQRRRFHDIQLEVGRQYQEAQKAQSGTDVTKHNDANKTDEGFQ